jgi:hypothetical protein
MRGKVKLDCFRRRREKRTFAFNRPASRQSAAKKLLEVIFLDKTFFFN